MQIQAHKELKYIEIDDLYSIPGWFCFILCIYKTLPTCLIYILYILQILFPYFGPEVCGCRCHLWEFFLKNKSNYEYIQDTQLNCMIGSEVIVL